MAWRSTKPQTQENNQAIFSLTHSSGDVQQKLPWHYLDDSIEVALTGPAFRHIRENALIDPYTYNSVCSKA